MTKKSKCCFVTILVVILCIFSFLLGEKTEKRDVKDQEVHVPNPVQQIENEKGDEKSYQFESELEEKQDEKKEDGEQASENADNTNAENEYKAFIKCVVKPLALAMEI